MLKMAHVYILYSHGNPNSWKAYVGLVALSRKSDPSVQERNVIYIYNHDNYTGSPWYNNDVSLFQVNLKHRCLNFVLLYFAN